MSEGRERAERGSSPRRGEGPTSGEGPAQPIDADGKSPPPVSHPAGIAVHSLDAREEKSTGARAGFPSSRPPATAGPIPVPSPADLGIPVLPAGTTVGLFGGSFDPPHEGHLLVAETALRRLRLDRLWWLVSPGNPLKAHDGLAPLAARIALSRAVARHPRISVTAFEAAHALRYTADLVALLRRCRPELRFVWIMGADSLGTFHLWQDWRRIAAAVPIAVVDRPGATLRSLHAPAALALARTRLREADAPRLARAEPPAWIFLHGPRSPLSSTGLRRDGVSRR